MKKRLLITGSTFPRWEGDTEPRFVLDLAKALQKYAEVTVLVPAAPGACEDEVMEGLHVVRYHYFPIHALETLCYPGAIVPRIKQKKTRALLVPWLFAAMFFQVKKWGKRQDLVLANWLIPQGIVQACAGGPYYVIGHGGDVTSLDRGIFKWLKRCCLRRADGVAAVSKPLQQHMQQLYDNPNSAVISMGCNIKLFGTRYRQENYFGQAGEKVVLFVGRLAEKKGVCFLLEAIRLVPGARLVVVGDGPLRSELENLARPLGKRVRFEGAKTHEELKYIYASSDIFAMPSVTAKDGDQEGFGLVMLEAFASGLPVVASDSGGIRDLIQEGHNGFLVPEKDPRMLAMRLNQLVLDNGERVRLGKNALETAKQYDYEVIGKKYAQFMHLI